MAVMIYQDMYYHFPLIKDIVKQKERPVDFIDEAVIDSYFLLTASVIALITS